MKLKIGDIEKGKGLPEGTFRNKNGRDTRSDKQIDVKPNFNNNRKVRSDCMVETLEKQIGQSGIIRNASGRKIRNDKKIANVRKQSTK